MAKKKRTKNDIAWSKAVKNFKQRAAYWRDKGYEINFKITKPEKVTKKDIEWLNKQGQKQFKLDKIYNSKRLWVYSRDTKPIVSELRNQIFKDLKRTDYKLSPNYDYENARKKEAELEKFREQNMREVRLKAIEEQVKQENEEFAYEQLKERGYQPEEIFSTAELQGISVSDMLHQLEVAEHDYQMLEQGRKQAELDFEEKQRQRLRDLGMTDVQIDTGLDYGETYDDMFENWYSESEDEDYYTDTSTNSYEGATYYLDPDTGKIYGETDPRIYEKVNGKYQVDISDGTLKIKSNLERHSGEILDKEMYEQVKWANFIGNFEGAHSSHFENVNPTPIFEELRTKVGTDEFIKAMYELDNEGSNVTDVGFWYRASAEVNITKLSTILSKVEKNTGNTFKDLRDHIENLRQAYESDSYWTTGNDRVRQVNAARYHK